MAETNRGAIIGFDAKRLTHNATGLGNYSRFVAECLGRFAPEIQQVHSSLDIGNPKLYQEQMSFPSFHLVTSKAGKLPVMDYLWRNHTSKSTLLKRGVQLFHGLSNELPSTITQWGIPSVVTMHDLIYELFPQYYRSTDALLYHHKYSRSCTDATKIIAVSACTKRDLIRMYDVPEEKIEVVYQGCAPIFSKEFTPTELERIRSKYRLSSPFILSVGTIEERKNSHRLVEALSLIKNMRLTLVLVGKETKYTETVRRRAEELKLSKRVKILTKVPFEDLPLLYRLAALFALPSIYEGFGIPILEALNSGTPVVAATGSCLEEAGGPDSLYANPYSPDDLALAIEKVPSQREKMIERGKAWSQNFLPEKIAPQLATLYRSLIY